MPLTTLTSKGQLTITKKVRESLNLHSDDKIEIYVTGDMEAVIRPVSTTQSITEDLYLVPYSFD